jgi:hypothetical protein
MAQVSVLREERGRWIRGMGGILDEAEDGGGSGSRWIKP